MKTNPLSIAVCILFFEKPDQTIDCIRSFLPSKLPIYVLNNGSSEKSTAKLERFAGKYPNICILKTSQNLGVAVGRNYLIQHSREPWLFFVDNDITIKPPNWPGLLAAHMSKHPEVKVFAPKLYNVHDGKYKKPYSIVVTGNQIEYQTDESGYRNVFSGGASMVNRQIFDEFGLYDDQMFVGLEDIEFALRSIRQGTPMKVLLIEDVLLHHNHRPTKTREDNQANRIRYDVEQHVQSEKRIYEKHGLIAPGDIEKWVQKRLSKSTPKSFRQQLRIKMKRLVKQVRQLC